MPRLPRVLLILFTLLLPLAAHAAEGDDALLRKAEAYLNGVKTLQARFIQSNPDGGSYEGTLYISRPGRMRLVYDPPTPMLMVADGRFLIYVDTEMNDASHLDLDETPAGLLLKENLSFDDPAIKILSVKQATGTVEITTAMAKDTAAGKLTMVFSDAPFELRQWRVLDAQHKEVTVTLNSPKLGVTLNRDLFRYDARRARNRDQ